MKRTAITLPGDAGLLRGHMVGWYAYMIENGNGKLYTGVSTDPLRRFEEHRSGRGARFFRLGRAARIVYIEYVGDRSTALRREYEIKQLPRSQKLKLIPK